MAYSRIRFEIQNSATMTLVHSPVSELAALHVGFMCLLLFRPVNSSGLT
jgi:hypothetical protein